MLSAIGSSTYASSSGIGPSIAGLQARLERYQKQLSDCVNCDSAKTLTGREAIQALSNKVSETKARIEEISAAKSNSLPVTIDAKPPVEIGAKKDGAAAVAQNNSAGVTGSSSEAMNATVGSLLDVFA